MKRETLQVKNPNLLKVTRNPPNSTRVGSNSQLSAPHHQLDDKKEELFLSETWASIAYSDPMQTYDGP